MTTGSVLLLAIHSTQPDGITQRSVCALLSCHGDVEIDLCERCVYFRIAIMGEFIMDQAKLLQVRYFSTEN